MQSGNSRRCLVLNADYTPMAIISWQKAMVWAFKCENDSKISIEVIDFYENDFINGTNDRKYAIPSIIKTTKYFHVHSSRVKFSRKNLFIRDDYTCQYCDKEYEIKHLTYDHVIPKSQWNNTGSPTNWTNIVTACVHCNRKKSNKTPKQANMPLKRNPFVPQKSRKYLPLAHQLNTILKDLPREWQTYVGDVAEYADL